MKIQTKITLKCPPPRNPLVLHSLARNAGSHRKSDKVIRAQEKMALKQNLRNGRFFQDSQPSHKTSVFEMAPKTNLLENQSRINPAQSCTPALGIPQPYQGGHHGTARHHQAQDFSPWPAHTPAPRGGGHHAPRTGLAQRQDDHAL